MAQTNFGKFFSSFFFVNLLFATHAFSDASPAPSPVPPSLSVDQIIDILGSSLSIAKGLPGVLGAIFVGIVALAIALLLIAKYFMDRGVREREAYETDLRVRKLQAENLSRMQRDATIALISNMDLSYKQDYEYFVLKIRDGKYEAVYVKINPKFHEKLVTFLYDAALTPEERAARVILVIKPA